MKKYRGTMGHLFKELIMSYFLDYYQSSHDIVVYIRKKENRWAI